MSVGSWTMESEGPKRKSSEDEEKRSAHSFLISPIEELLELNRGSFLYREIEEGLKEYIEGDSTHEEMVEEFKKKGLDEVEANILAYYVKYKRAEGREDENEMKRIEGELVDYYSSLAEKDTRVKEKGKKALTKFTFSLIFSEEREEITEEEWGFVLWNGDVFVEWRVDGEVGDALREGAEREGLDSEGFKEDVENLILSGNLPGFVRLGDNVNVGKVVRENSRIMGVRVVGSGENKKIILVYRNGERKEYNYHSFVRALSYASLVLNGVEPTEERIQERVKAINEIIRGGFDVEESRQLQKLISLLSGDKLEGYLIFYQLTHLNLLNEQEAKYWKGLTFLAIFGFYDEELSNKYWKELEASKNRHNLNFILNFSINFARKHNIPLDNIYAFGKKIPLPFKGPSLTAFLFRFTNIQYIKQERDVKGLANMWRTGTENRDPKITATALEKLYKLIIQDTELLSTILEELSTDPGKAIDKVAAYLMEKGIDKKTAYDYAGALVNYMVERRYEEIEAYASSLGISLPPKEELLNNINKAIEERGLTSAKRYIQMSKNPYKLEYNIWAIATGSWVVYSNISSEKITSIDDLYTTILLNLDDILYGNDVLDLMALYLASVFLSSKNYGKTYHSFLSWLSRYLEREELTSEKKKALLRLTTKVHGYINKRGSLPQQITEEYQKVMEILRSR